jgi:hypothetical protein
MARNIEDGDILVGNYNICINKFSVWKIDGSGWKRNNN